MRISRRAVVAINTVLLIGGVSCATLNGRRAPNPVTSAWTVPVDVVNASSPSQVDWYNLGWQTFIAINWPAVAPSATNNRGQPDTTQSLGASSSGALIPPVWLTYRDISGTFLANGADPGAWNSPPSAPPSTCKAIPAGAVAPGFQPMVLDMTSKVAKTIGTGDFFINEASGNPVIDQAGNYILYDVRLNQSEYSYIQMKSQAYYNAANQVAAYTPPNTGIAPFPRTGTESMFQPALPSYAQYGALEVKAAWRILNPSQDILSRYYTQTGYFLQPDGTCEGPLTFGLVGLHILRLTPTTPATWYWATFEQVDNVQINGTAPMRPNGQPLTPTLAAVNTPNGNCTSAYNQPAPIATGNIPIGGNAPVNVCREVPIPSDVAAVNATWQASPGVQNSVWRFYELVNTINPSVQGGPAYSFPNNTSATVNVDKLANTTMETYSQTESCMSCHAYAAPQGSPTPLTSANQIFTFLLSNADTASPAAATSDATVRHRVRFHVLPKRH